MKNKSEGSCSKGCLCDTCSGQSKSIQSEAFKEKAAELVNKTKEAGKKIKNAATLGLGDTHGQEWTTTSNLSGSFPGAVTAAAAAFNVARRTVDAFRESSEYIGSKEHYDDLVDRYKEDMKNFGKETDSYARQHLQRIARKSFENVQNHPLHLKNEQSNIVTKKETNMLKESHFIVGDILQNNTKQTMQGVEPEVPHEVVKVGQSGGPFSAVTYHLKNTKTGKIHPFANAHMLLKRLNEELKTVDDVTKTLPRGVEKKGPGEAYGTVDKCAPVSKDKDKTVVAGKTGEEYSKKPQTEVKEMSEDKYTRLAEAAFGPLNRSNPFRTSNLMNEGHKVGDNVAIHMPGYAAHGHKGVISRIDPDRTATVHLNPGKGAHGVNTKMRLSGGMFGPKPIEVTGMNVHTSGTHTSVPLSALRKLTESYETLDEVEQMDEGDVIQFKPKPTPKPSKVITTATRRPPGPRPVKENVNQRFPDVERDIAAIMKESYKKKKMQEEAANMYIATAEQREDWLNVGRGSMDVLDYINKYKV